MKPAARVQAAIEILDLIIAAARSQGAPADRILAEWFRGHRFAGSKDKRGIRDHVYAAIRACGEIPRSGRAAMLRLVELEPDLGVLFDGTPYGPAAIGEGEVPAAGGIAPEWLEDELIASDIEVDDAKALLGRATLDLRVNKLKLTRDSLSLPAAFENLPAPCGVRVEMGNRVEQWDAYLRGEIEVQDSGSQLACDAVGALPGETVIDLCAGAGGKSLALCAAMENSGLLVAADTDRGRLQRLAPRAQRAGVEIVREVLLNPGKELSMLDEWRGKADRVLVDAPCSGTGTWRRNPEARWRLTDSELARLVVLQARLLEIAAELVRPGGRLVYVTCSLLDDEGAGQIDRFMANHPGWRATPPALDAGQKRGEGKRLMPLHDKTDGFFIACIEKP